MLKVLLVGFGGFIGSIARYLLSTWVQKISYNGSGSTLFPIGTLAVNICGCFLIGLIGGYFTSRQVMNPEIRLFLFLGVLGGFTTFSAFGYDTFSLAKSSQLLAAANVLFQILLGLGAVWAGNAVSKML